MFDTPQGLVDTNKYAVFSHSFRAFGEISGYELYVELNDAAEDLYNWKLIGAPGELSGTTSLLEQGESNLVTVAYLGDNCIIWINHQILVQFNDQQHNGTVNRLVTHTDQGTVKVVIDDLRFWVLEEGDQAGMPTPAPTDSSAALPTMENSVTPNPRSTADLPWVADFATPLMESARRTAPTFQDSFDYLRAEWQTAGNVTIQPDGAVFATDPDLEPPTLRGSPLSAREFVLQFDMRAAYSPAVGEGSESMLALNLIISDDEWYALYIVLNDAPAESAAHAWSVYQFPENILLVQGMTPAFDATGWTRLEVLFSDNHMGLLINDQPVTYFGAPASGNLTKDITLGAIAKTEAMTLLIDNLKLWDLEHLSASINPEPDLAFLAYRMPEITDEFNLIDPQWQIDAGATGVDNGQLLLVTNSDGYVRMQHPALNAMDFMVSFDFQVLSQGSDLAVMSLEYRITNQTRYIFSLSYELEQVRWYLSYNEANDVNTELASGLLPGFDIAAVHQVKAGASGCQLWVTLDDSLLTYIPTNRLSEGQINLVMKSNSRTASYALDSFRYWNLDQQPVVLGFGSDEEHDFIRPILRTSESADYAEYFASVPGDWQISASESDEFTAMGMAILSISGGGSIELQPPLGTPADFGLQFDLALGELSGDTEIFVEFGLSAATYTLSFTPHNHSLRLELGGDLLAEIQNPWVAPGGWLRVLLVVQADRIGVYLNGEPQLFLNVSADPSGEVRLRFDSAAEAAFLLDTFLLWDLTATP